MTTRKGRHMSAKPRPDRYALDYRLFDHLPSPAGPDLVALSGNEARAEHREFGCWSMVPLATVFPTEPRHFAPWFESRRLAELGRLVRRRLTSPSSERAAGSGFIDTLAVDAVTRFYVGIEYQFRTSDDSHVRRLRSYVDGTGARLGILVAERISQPHLLIADRRLVLVTCQVFRHRSTGEHRYLLAQVPRHRAATEPWLPYEWPSPVARRRRRLDAPPAV